MNYSQNMWQQFLRRPLLTPDQQSVQIHKWTEHLVRFGLMPVLSRTGYILICKPQELATCILNNIIRHEADYNKCRFTTYRCKHREEVTIEEFEHYEELIPEEVWKQLKQSFEIDWLADEGPFAERIWRHLIHIVFDHLSMDSPANQALYEKMKFMMEDEDSLSDE